MLINTLFITDDNEIARDDYATIFLYDIRLQRTMIRGTLYMLSDIIMKGNIEITREIILQRHKLGPYHEMDLKNSDRQICVRFEFSPHHKTETPFRKNPYVIMGVHIIRDFSIDFKDPITTLYRLPLITLHCVSLLYADPIHPSEQNYMALT